MTVSSRSPRNTARTIGLCYLIAVTEGIDLQSMGIAAPKMIHEFGLNAAQFGLAASASPAGLLAGAVIGGRLADRIGRKRVLVASILAFGFFSLLTARMRSYDALLVVRALVGLGLGGAFPNLIALCSEVATPERRATFISVMYAGIPMGTVIGTLIVLATGNDFQWRWIFYLGGFAPIALVPILILALPESARFRALHDALPDERVGRPPIARILFGDGRLVPTLLLWVGFFCTLLVVYLMTNWLNQLMRSRGFDQMQSTLVLLAFGIGSMLGGIAMGVLSDTRLRGWTAMIAYGGVASCLYGLASFTSYLLLTASGFGVGFFAVGAQLVNYSLAPRFYPVAIRATGVGWTVAIGRAGSVAGPLLAGMLLQNGMAASKVLILFVPGLVIAAVTATTLLRSPDLADH